MTCSPDLSSRSSGSINPPFSCSANYRTAVLSLPWRTSRVNFLALWSCVSTPWTWVSWARAVHSVSCTNIVNCPASHESILIVSLRLMAEDVFTSLER
jgi:hypothetical protein